MQETNLAGSHTQLECGGCVHRLANNFCWVFESAMVPPSNIAPASSCFRKASARSPTHSSRTRITWSYSRLRVQLVSRKRAWTQFAAKPAFRPPAVPVDFCPRWPLWAADLPTYLGGGAAAKPGRNDESHQVWNRHISIRTGELVSGAVSATQFLVAKTADSRVVSQTNKVTA